MVSSPLRILGIAGSLRQKSFNRSALRVAQKLVPAGVVMDIYELESLPLFNQDQELAPPQQVVKFKSAIEAADAVLFVTPEYNYSITGVLKNAIDWGSRPYGKNSWGGKPAAIMGASPGNLGTARAQYHLRQCLVSVDMPTVNQPEVMIAKANEKFNDQGELIDKETEKRIAQLLQKLVDLTRKLTLSS